MSALIDGNELFKKSFCDHSVDQDFGNLPLLLCNVIILKRMHNLDESINLYYLSRWQFYKPWLSSSTNLKKWEVQFDKIGVYAGMIRQKLKIRHFICIQLILHSIRYAQSLLSFHSSKKHLVGQQCHVFCKYSRAVVTQWLLYGNPKFARKFCLWAHPFKFKEKEQCKERLTWFLNCLYFHKFWTR